MYGAGNYPSLLFKSGFSHKPQTVVAYTKKMWRIWSTILRRRRATAETATAQSITTQKGPLFKQSSCRVSDYGRDVSNGDDNKGAEQRLKVDGYLYKNTSSHDFSTCSSAVLADGELLVRRGLRGGVSSLEITLNRPRYLNAITMKMVDAISTIFREVEETPSKIGLLIFRGAGDKAFCAGVSPKNEIPHFLR